MKEKTFNPKKATPQQLAAHLSMSDSQVIKLMKRGTIPTVVREGRIYRFDIEEVDKVLAERARAQTPASTP
jgi:predicted DNA-binding transcriptional regulator AlpA